MCWVWDLPRCGVDACGTGVPGSLVTFIFGAGCSTGSKADIACPQGYIGQNTHTHASGLSLSAPWGHFDDFFYICVAFRGPCVAS